MSSSDEYGVASWQRRFPLDDHYRDLADDGMVRVNPSNSDSEKSQHGTSLELEDLGDGDDDSGSLPPPHLASPSLLSSVGNSAGLSPFYKGPSPTSPNDDGISPVSSGRLALARRLSQLAKQLTDHDEESHAVDLQHAVLSRQIDVLESSVDRSRAKHLIRSHSDPKDRGVEGQRRSNVISSSPPGIPSSTVSSRLQYNLSDLSLSQDLDSDGEDSGREEPVSKKGMTVRQAKKIIAETVKLNDELSQVVENLSARQEEAEHIQGLLFERAERAAQRILFLQSRITYLEEELQENDEELQHLRISLKAVEVQLPPHPDQELQRCIAAFKDDYQALKRKRGSERGSFAAGWGSSSPAR